HSILIPLPLFPQFQPSLNSHCEFCREGNRGLVEILLQGEEMGRLFFIALEGNFYSCKHCKTHLALSKDIISRTFYCRHGRAYLFNDVVNVSVGEQEERMMITGLHTVVDIFCVGCGSIIGWKYEVAYDKSQKYKEGKYILEMFKVLGPDGTGYLASHDPQLVGSDGDDA
uniref:Yippee domain-containing protein n=2 Tax=Cucumis melo TaxID=3656 RepID=A0A9I9CGL9_CUCME